jgi:hypothetical protein
MIGIGQQLNYKIDKSYWIGLNVLNSDKGYQWTDGLAVSFLNWNSGQPDNHNGLENCADIRSNYLWNDVNCYVSKGWMCKIAKGVDPNVNPIVTADNFTGK